MKFFAPDVWLGKEIVFPDDPEVIWVLSEKLSEDSRQLTKEVCAEFNASSIAWAVFSCHPKDDMEGKHAMKIYMQVPWTDTEFESAASRKAQADINRSDSMASEIKALRLLTENGSTHTPHLISDFHTTQDDDGIVPTGFISYILMTWCPGVTLGDGDYRRKTKSEQARIFQAFREALEDTKRCGVVSNGLGPGNLIWDAAHNKCYMVDFKWSGPPSEWDIAEEVWMSWGLQPGPPRLEMERL